MRDPISASRVKLLHPAVRQLFSDFITECENTLNVTLRVVQGLRTFEEQDAIYAQGRTKPGAIVTNARAGSSYHNYGLAVDLVELKDGQANWNFKYKLLQPIARKYGLTWGADWDNDGLTKADGDKDEHLVDMPHFQMTYGKRWQELLAMYKVKHFIADTRYVDFQRPERNALA